MPSCLATLNEIKAPSPAHTNKDFFQAWNSGRLEHVSLIHSPPFLFSCTLESTAHARTLRGDIFLWIINAITEWRDGTPSHNLPPMRTSILIPHYSRPTGATRSDQQARLAREAKQERICLTSMNVVKLHLDHWFAVHIPLEELLRQWCSKCIVMKSVPAEINFLVCKTLVWAHAYEWCLGASMHRPLPPSTAGCFETLQVQLRDPSMVYCLVGTFAYFLLTLFFDEVSNSWDWSHMPLDMLYILSRLQQQTVAKPLRNNVV